MTFFRTLIPARRALFITALSAILVLTCAPSGNSVSSQRTDRVDNIRLLKIDFGPSKGQYVVAGRLDHLPSAKPQDVRIRMILRTGGAESKVIGRSIQDYQLPAGMTPMNMPIRWVLTPVQSRDVHRNRDSAVVTIDVWQDRTGGKHVTTGKRHSVSATNLTVQDASTNTTRSVVMKERPFPPPFVPFGIYLDESKEYGLTTTEDDSGRVQVSTFWYDADEKTADAEWLVLDVKPNGDIEWNNSINAYAFSTNNAEWAVSVAGGKRWDPFCPECSGDGMTASIAGSFASDGSAVSVVVADVFDASGEQVIDGGEITLSAGADNRS